ncbi:MAG TPA: hypothetical protein DEP84_08950, partial [Chloroflexi bacterium]|nr:hypothetical protein [Chloroflexota bacterium]
MIDLHCHILPAVDDGPPDWKTSLEMVRIAAEDGITVMAATPHDVGWQGPKPPRILVPFLVAQLNRRVRQAGLDIKVVAGMEALIDPGLAARVDAGTVLRLSSSRYVLVELPFSLWPQFTEAALFQLQVRGYRPILAHVERYQAVQAQPERLMDLVSRGIMLQVTGHSLTGLFGKDVRATAEQLLEANLVHLLASDCHTPRGRRPELAAARVA